MYLIDYNQEKLRIFNSEKHEDGQTKIINILKIYLHSIFHKHYQMLLLF